jgi:hypothetical protein
MPWQEPAAPQPAAASKAVEVTASTSVFGAAKATAVIAKRMARENLMMCE